MAKEERKGVRALTRDNLVGMKVIDGDGFLMGEVKDVAFTVGRLDLVLIVKTKEGDKEVPWGDVQAVGDFVVLKPKAAPAAAPTPTCPTCGSPLVYVEQYKRWYCPNCKKYV